MSLIRLMPGGDVLSSTLNDNFDYLEGLISSSVSTLDAKVNSTTGNIANITSNMATIQTNLTNVANTANSKASLDLANINANGKANVTNWLAPNYGAGAGKSFHTTYVAEKMGIIVVNVSGQGGSGLEVNMYIDGVLVNESDSWMRDAGQGWSCWGLVPKGSWYRVDSGLSGTLVFYPLKGAV